MKKFTFLIAALFLSVGVMAQNITISGKTLNSKGEPIANATVKIKGLTGGTVTDQDGSFTIKAKDISQTLIVSIIGYKSQEVIINANRIVEVRLEEDANKLSEVNIKGFSADNSRARRRAESLQRTPESVTTFTSEQIEKTGINNIQNFATLIPNVSLNTSQNVGVNFISVRGISQIRNGDAPVAFVIDDVTVADANLINQDLFDLAMVEVVKGPQGALYGKNAIGGAINIYTNTPTNSYQNKLLLGYGNGNTVNAQGSFSGPIIKDKFYYRISGSIRNSDGLITNEFLKKEVDFLKDYNGRVQLKYNFSPMVSTTVSTQFIDTKGGATYYAHTKSEPSGRMKADDFNNIINTDQLGNSTLKNTFISQNTQIKGEKVIFKIITSYNDAKRYHQGDLDFGPGDVLRQLQNSDSKTFNQEFRLMDNIANAKLKWSVGAFYQNSQKYLYTKATADFGFFAAPFTPTKVQNTLAILSNFTNTNNSIALFGFLDYKISNKLTASVGLRYDNDKITQQNNLLNTSPSKTSNQLQPKLSLSYQGTDNVLVYSNFGRGFRSGGYNAAATASFNNDFDAETSNNYEIGIKTSTKDNRFIFNASGFVIDFNNQQQYVVSVAPSGLVLGNYNIAKTKVSGFEADVKWRTSKFLDILGGYGLSTSIIKKAELKGTTNYNKFNGNKTPFVPVSNYFIALQSSIPINKNVAFNGFVNLNGKGKIYWHEDNIDVAKPYSLLDARIGVSVKNKFGITLWGNNITDTKYYQEYYAKAVSGGGFDIGWRGRPTSFGLELNYKF